MNLQEYLSLKIHQAEIAATTHETFCLIWGVKRDLLNPPIVDKILKKAVRDRGEGGGGTAAMNDTMKAEADVREVGEDR